MTSNLARAPRAIVYLLFFLSGFAALLYQVIWQRVLALFSGADVYSVTIIVAAFMAGLGLGSWAGGSLADRLTPWRRIVAFAAAELGVAGFALASLPLYHGVFGQWSALAASPILLALILFGGLLIPTFLMGVSLPLLAAAATRSIAEASSVVGRLYCVNTLGAAVGAFIATWFLARLYGFEVAVHVGAALNALTALAALAIAPSLMRRVVEIGAAAPTPEAGAPGTAPGSTFRPEWWFALYAASGFLALSLEIIWFRLLGVIIKSNAFTFGTLLTVYLAGLAAGAGAGVWLARRSRNPTRDFLALQTCVTLYAAASIFALWWLVDKLPALGPLWLYMQQYEGYDVAGAFRSTQEFLQAPGEHWRAKPMVGLLMLYGLLPLFLVGPPTLLMGASFPLLQRAVQTDLARLGRRVGALQGWNIAGSMAGALLTGLVLLRFLGTSGALRCVMLASGVFVILLISALRPRRPWLGGLGAAGLLALLVVIPSGPALWARLHGEYPRNVLLAEDGSGVVAIKGAGLRTRDGDLTVYLGGLGQSNVPFPHHHISLGLVPIMLHPDPKDIVIIGLGSGATLYGASGRAETERLFSLEIVKPLHTTLTSLAGSDDYAALREVVAEPRVHNIFGDGRAFLRRSERQYDIIEADALRPTSAYAGNLYSQEYFELLRSRLKPHGLAVTWAPTERAKRTFLSVFPYVVHYEPDVSMLIGSNEPITWDAAAMTRRLQHPFSVAHYGSASEELLQSYVEMFATVQPTFYGPEFDRTGLADLNRDLFPRDEFMTPAAD